MKKITCILTFTFSSLLMFGQVVLNEDFESSLAIPAGWTNNDLVVPSNGEIWTFETGGFAALGGAANTLVYSLGGADGNYAAFNSDAYGDNGFAENAALESPVFNASALTDVTLSFNSLFAGNFGGTAFVEVLNGDAPIPNWETVQTYTADNYNGGILSLDVSTQLAGVTNAQVRFRWTGNWSVAWYIDNVSVFQCTIDAPGQVSAIAPANGATNVAINYGSDINNLGPIEWAPAITGGDADSYNISLGTTPTGDDIGTVNGFGTGGSINFNWQPGTTYYWFITAVNCAGTTDSPVFSFTTAACTDISAPAATSGPVPANAATEVGLNVDGNSLAFSWTAGGPDDDFVLNLGTTNPPTQAFNNFENGDIITGLETNTTYFWSVDAVNCFGITPGTVWSFTTSETLSIVDANDADLFSVFPNPTRDILNITSSDEVDSVIVYNLIGQNVAAFTRSDIVNQSIDLSMLSTGLYLVKISAGNQTQTIRITKQ